VSSTSRTFTAQSAKFSLISQDCGFSLKVLVVYFKIYYVLITNHTAYVQSVSKVHGQL